MSDWREQYARVRRWRYRIADYDSTDAASVVDTFFAFAQACAHMVDWLENDRSQAIRRDEAERHVNDSAALAFCRDVSNGSKHARLQEKNVSLAEKLRLVGWMETKNREGEVVRAKWVSTAELSVECDGRWVPIPEFAHACVAAWEDLPSPTRSPQRQWHKKWHKAHRRLTRASVTPKIIARPRSSVG